MYNERVERSAGWSGIAFVIVVVLAAVLPGAPPPPDSAPQALMAYLDGHRFMWQLAGWLIFPGTCFFLWWLVQFRAYLRLVPQIDDGLPTYMLLGGVLSSMTVLLVASAQILSGLRPASVLGPAIVQLLFDMFNGFGAIVFMPLTVMVFAASNSGRLHGSLPKALVWWGYLTAAGCAVSSLSVFFTTGFLALGYIGTVVLGLLPLTVWIIWASIILIRSPRTGPANAP